MKKIRLNSILVLVILAMLALLVIQIFQSVQLYDQKTAEFNEQFSTTLDRVSMRHEKAEDIRKYMAIVNKDFAVKYKDILKEEFKNLMSTEESISIEDTLIYEGGEMQKYLIIKGKTYDSISGVTAEQRVLARNAKELRDLFSRSNNAQSGSLEIQLDERVVQQIFKKARYVNEIMLNAFRNNVYINPEERLNITFLDSVLETEFDQEKLPKNYQFCVTDVNYKPIAFKGAPSNYVTDVDTSNMHNALLFPSNTLDDPMHLHISFPNQKSFLLGEMWVSLLFNFALVVVILIALIFMFRTILSQKRLYEMKNDFISNMTHEFKTPISTISLACEAMNDSDMVSQVPQQAHPYIKMINEENKRLGVLVERILQSATLEKGELKIRSEELILNDLIEEVVQNAQFRISGSGGKINMDITHEPIKIVGDKMHLTNMVSNLVDNAVKYSKGSPDVSVSLTKENGAATLRVVDKGIGIKKEHINKIFDKLYRIPTGNIHNVKGFGLGLSYVKAIAELHGWTINVKSKFGAGSEFNIVIN